MLGLESDAKVKTRLICLFMWVADPGVVNCPFVPGYLVVIWAASNVQKYLGKFCDLLFETCQGRLGAESD